MEQNNWSHTEWEAYTDKETGLPVVLVGNERFMVNPSECAAATDRVKDFVDWYVGDMERLFPAHIIACEAKLKQRLGLAYKTVRFQPLRYRFEIAAVSLNCLFGVLDGVPDHTFSGEYNPEHTVCPERYCCPFNGFGDKAKDCVLCNPVWNLGLTRKQAEIADKIVNTNMDYAEIAESEGCSVSNIDNIRKRIFAACGVSTRPELVLMLRGKRIY